MIVFVDMREMLATEKKQKKPQMRQVENCTEYIQLCGFCQATF